MISEILNFLSPEIQICSMPNQNDVNIQSIEDVMTEVRRNWSVMLQSDVLKLLSSFISLLVGFMIIPV